MRSATISMVFASLGDYATDDDINGLFEYELPLTTEKSRELWTNVGTAIQTFINSSKTESDKATLKEALSVGFGIPFCYLLKDNIILDYNSYLDNVVNNLTSAKLDSQVISQMLSYVNQINDIITTIGNDATLTSGTPQVQLTSLVEQFCRNLGWSCTKGASSYIISDSAGAKLIEFSKFGKVFSNNKVITLKNLYNFMINLYNDLRNKI